jgi:ribosomal-protein-alanine N-acetyltransferase
MKMVPLVPDYLEAVTHLESTAGDVGWSRAHFEKEASLPFSRFFVLILEEQVCGYGGFWKVVDEAQITNLVIAPERRRQGWGQKVLQHLIDRARQEKCTRGTLEVRAQNQAAQALYRKAGFANVGRRAKVYQKPIEDAVLMEMML